MSLGRTYRSPGRSRARYKLAACSQKLSKSVARELVQLVHASLHRRIVSDTDALCSVARFYSASSGLRVT